MACKLAYPEVGRLNGVSDSASSRDLSENRRPFRILGVQQIAIGSRDRSSAARLWVALLGLVEKGSYQSAAENVDEAILELGEGARAVEVDLMQPLDETKKPKIHEPALHHVGLWVDDLRACVAFLSQHGVRFTSGGIRRGAAGHDICFIHPHGNDSSPIGGHGVLIELVQAPAELLGS